MSFGYLAERIEIRERIRDRSCWCDVLWPREKKKEVFAGVEQPDNQISSDAEFLADVTYDHLSMSSSETTTVKPRKFNRRPRKATESDLDKQFRIKLSVCKRYDVSYFPVATSNDTLTLPYADAPRTSRTIKRRQKSKRPKSRE